MRRWAGKLQGRGRTLRVLGGILHRVDLVLHDPGQIPIIWRRTRLVWRLGGMAEVMRILGRRRFGATADGHDYRAWTRRYDSMSEAGRRRLGRRLARLSGRPRFLVVLEGGGEGEAGPELPDLAAQLYPAWGLAESPGTPADYVLRLDRRDRLPPYALAAMALALVKEPAWRLVVFDHDAMTAGGRRAAPVFKPDWNETLLLSGDYVGPGLLVERRLAEEIGFLAPTLDSAARFALLLRAAEKLPAREIGHLPQVLLHTAPDAGARGGLLAGDSALWGGPAEPPPWPGAGRLASAAVLASHIGAAGRVLDNPLGPGFRVAWSLPDPPPSVEVIVPTRDRLDLLRPCLETLLERTDYPRFGVTVIDNDSREPETRDYLARLAGDARVTLRADPRPFNYAALNNAAIEATSADLVCLLNNDIEVLQPGWLAEMVGWALRPGVGAVGACLLYPDGSLQHAGVGLGLGDAAGHLYRGRPASGPEAPRRALVAQELSAVTAACLLISRRLYRDLGGLDEAHFPVAYNDVDLCLKVTAAGRRIVWTPHARLLHRESQSRGQTDTAEKLARQMREIGHLRRRWRARLEADPHYSPNLSIYDEQSSLAWPPRLARPWL